MVRTALPDISKYAKETFSHMLELYKLCVNMTSENTPGSMQLRATSLVNHSWDSHFLNSACNFPHIFHNNRRSEYTHGPGRLLPASHPSPSHTIFLVIILCCSGCPTYRSHPFWFFFSPFFTTGTSINHM